MNTSFLDPCTKSFKWRAGNNDGKWRAIDVDDRSRPEGSYAYLWEVTSEWHIDEYDGMPWDVDTGFVIAADDYDSVWRQMCAKTDLNESEYDDTVWKIKLIGVDLTTEGPRIISTTSRNG